MNPELALPHLTQTSDAWLVEVPSFYGCQCYRFAVEAQARRFLALFVKKDSPKARAQPT